MVAARQDDGDDTRSIAGRILSDSGLSVNDKTGEVAAPRGRRGTSSGRGASGLV